MWTWFSKHSRKLIDGFLSYLDWIKSLYNTVKYKDVQASCTFFFFFFYTSGTTYRTNTNGSTPNILFVSPLLYSLTLQGTFVVCAIVKKKAVCRHNKKLMISNIRSKTWLLWGISITNVTRAASGAYSTRWGMGSQSSRRKLPTDHMVKCF